MRRRRSSSPDEAKVDFTPIIDIVFNLLIFFMCATKIRSTDHVIECFLPKTRGLGTAPASTPLNDVRVKLLWHDDAGRPSTTEAGHVVVAIGDRRLNAPGELEAARPEAHQVWRALGDRLAELRSAATSPDLPVIIDARPQVPTKHVISALNEVVRLKFKDVTFAAPEKEF
jgi:biopolymer transport protein ExbD